MKKELAVFTLALGLASTAPAFAGEEKITPKKQPVKMTDARLDQVTAAGHLGHGGGLIDVDVIVRNNEIVKNVNVAAQAAIAVLSVQAVTFREITQ